MRPRTGHLRMHRRYFRQSEEFVPLTPYNIPLPWRAFDSPLGPLRLRKPLPMGHQGDLAGCLASAATTSASVFGLIDAVSARRMGRNGSHDSRPVIRIVSSTSVGVVGLPPIPKKVI
jgi:hypothetical protein